MYINTKTLTTHTESEIRTINPNTSFGAPFVPPADYALIFPAPQPTLTELQTAREVAPVLTDKGHWEQQWEAADMFSDYTDSDDILHTKAEQEAAFLEAKRLALVPKLVSMRQARLALLQANLLDDVEGAIAQAGPAAKIEWEYAQEVRRDSGLVPAMATALGMTELQLDALFTLAATF